MNDPAVLSFPLVGTWSALNSPADQVPSHGTDYFAQRFAIDFIRLREDPPLPYRGPIWRHFFAYLPASDFLCWNAPVLAAEGGRVVQAGDGWPDRMRVNLFYELARCTFVPPSPTPRDIRPLAGNHVIVEGASGFTLYAHLRSGSVAVKAGERIQAGSALGAVGSSGNSTMPHLHFQLMDGPDPLSASGLPIAFAGLEELSDGKWRPLPPGVPSEKQLVRTAGTPAP